MEATDLKIRVTDRAGTADRSRRSVESSEKAVARGIYLTSAVLLQHVADLRIERLKQLTPGTVAKGCGTLG
jgi:hypothetical protein